jgi:hypothetical protein
MMIDRPKKPGSTQGDPMKANNRPPRDDFGLPPQSSPNTINIDESALEGRYANLTRVIAGPEEVVIDFGLLVPNQQNPQQQNAKLSDRVVLNYYNAKRLAMTLNATITRYEQTFGPLELDAGKRQIGGGHETH